MIFTKPTLDSTNVFSLRKQTYKKVVYINTGESKYFYLKKEKR